MPLYEDQIQLFSFSQMFWRNGIIKQFVDIDHEIIIYFDLINKYLLQVCSLL